MMRSDEATLLNKKGHKNKLLLTATVYCHLFKKKNTFTCIIPRKTFQTAVGYATLLSHCADLMTYSKRHIFGSLFA